MKPLTTGKLARIANVAPRTVSKWCDLGKLKHYRIPGSLDRRIAVRDAVDFLKRNGMPLGELADLDVFKVVLVACDEATRNAVASALQGINSEGAEEADATAGGFVIAEKRPDLVVVDGSIGAAAIARLNARLGADPHYNPAVMAVGDFTDADVETVTADRQVGYVFRRPVDPDAVAAAVQALAAAKLAGR